MRAILFANGVFTPSRWVDKWLSGGGVLIAVDGGLRLCRALGLTPDFLIGDFDSLREEEVLQMESQGIKVKRYPAQKDETDLELALQLALEQSAGEIVILGGLGARWDQTFANVLLPASQRFRKVPVVLVDGGYELYVLNAPPPKKLQLEGEIGETLSLIPLGGDVKGVTLRGLEYPLHGEALFFGMTRGLSNVFRQNVAEIEVQEGSLLVVVSHFVSSMEA